MQEKLPLMEGTNHPCKMARQGESTAREERRDMGFKERGWGPKEGFNFWNLKGEGFVATKDFWMRCECTEYPKFPI